MLLCTSLLLHITLCLPGYVVGTRVILTEEKNSNPSKGSGKKCPIGYSCPLDTKCIMTKMNKPNCICPYNGRSAIEGVSCQNLELFDSGEIMFADSSDEECNPEEYGCGEQAVCDIHNGEGVCSCPGFGPVPKGQACGSKTDKKGNHSDASDYAVRESTRSAAACKNKHGWVDSTGDDCSWYERYDQRGCPKYGELFTGKHGKPNEGCCYCGGGVRYNDDAFTVIFMADMENLYRFHKHEWCARIAEYVKNIKYRNEYFSDHSYHKIDPKLVIHGGDLSDTTYEWKFTAEELYAQTYQRFYSAGIPMISILGNHDLLSNSYPYNQAERFVRQSFEKSKKIAGDFSFEEIKGTKNSYYVANFRGLQIASVNDKMEGTDSQWSEFKQKLDVNREALFFSHRPLASQNRALTDFIKKFPHPNHYAGHYHSYGKYTTYGVPHYVAPYLHIKTNYKDENPGFLALLVSPTSGVLETKKINFDYQKITGCWGDGSLCGSWTTCYNCCRGYEFWYSKALTSCGQEPCWADGIRCGIGTSCNICCNPYTYWTRLLFTACGRDPNPPSCMSGETNLMQVTVGSNGKRSRKIKPRKVKKLNVGDRIQGFNEELKPSNNCKVEAIGTFGTGTFYGNYTKDHFVYNKRTKAIQQHGKMSHSKTTGKTYEVFTSCPLGIDESGTMFTPIDSDFCGRELKSMAWSDYIILYRGILRVVRRTGGYWFNGKTYADMNQLHKYAAPVCRNMLKCMKNPKNCKDFEKSSKLFIENALTGPMKKKTYLKFGMKTNALNTAEYATISAVVTAGESKTKK